MTTSIPLSIFLSACLALVSCTSRVPCTLKPPTAQPSRRLDNRLPPTSEQSLLRNRYCQWQQSGPSAPIRRATLEAVKHAV
jgi:hypothetical protein